MAKNTWHVAVEDGAHTVVAEHGYFSGRIKVYLDGKVVLKRFRQRPTRNLGSLNHFNLSGHDAVFYIKSPDGIRYVYDLLLDGSSTTTGEIIETQQTRIKIPRWAWAFAAASLGAYLIGFWLPPWLFDAHPPTTFYWYGIALVAVMRCFRISVNETTSERDKITKSGIIVAATLALSATITSGNILFSQSYWHTASSPSGAYSISAPCAATEEATDNGIQISCYDANMKYSAWYENLSANYQGAQVDELLTNYMERVRHPKSGAKVEIIAETPLALQTYTGREYTVLNKATTVESRIYIVGNHAYHVQVIATNKSFNRTQAQKFLDSFHLAPTIQNSQ